MASSTLDNNYFYYSSWIAVDGTGLKSLPTIPNQLMIAATKTWEAIAEFWPDLPLMMIYFQPRK